MSDDGAMAAPRPDNVTLTQEADGIRIAYRWFSWRYVFLLAFCVFWDGFLVFWYHLVLAQPSRDNVMLWFPLIHVAVGLGLTYATLAGFVNRTSVRASTGELSVRHGPLPWLAPRPVPASDVAQLFREEILRTGRGGTTARYRLSAVLRNGRKRKLFTCESADVILYVEQEAERYLGIADRRVTGEMPR